MQASSEPYWRNTALAESRHPVGADGVWPPPYSKTGPLEAVGSGASATRPLAPSKSAEGSSRVALLSISASPAPFRGSVARCDKAPSGAPKPFPPERVRAIGARHLGVLDQIEQSIVELFVEILALLPEIFQLLEGCPGIISLAAHRGGALSWSVRLPRFHSDAPRAQIARRPVPISDLSEIGGWPVFLERTRALQKDTQKGRAIVSAVASRTRHQSIKSSAGRIALMTSWALNVE